jgi:hypothetical protein
MPTYAPLASALRGSQAAADNVEYSLDIFLMCEWYPEYFGVVRRGLMTPEESLFGRYAFKWVKCWLDAAQEHPKGTRLRNRYLSFAFTFNIASGFTDLMTDVLTCPPHETLEMFDWDTAFGENGSLLVEASEIYDFDKMHRYLVQKQSW